MRDVCARLAHQQSTSQAQLLALCGSTPPAGPQKRESDVTIKALLGDRPEAHATPCPCSCQTLHERCEACLKPSKCLAPEHLLCTDPWLLMICPCCQGQSTRLMLLAVPPRQPQCSVPARLASPQVPPEGNLSLKDFSRASAAALCQESVLSLRNLQLCSHCVVQEQLLPPLRIHGLRCRITATSP